ncbi:MAG: glycosyltransferase family 2 protein [Caldiserica bacterium]|nr:MAG: glycosyltransferase family 2 protein [Caldisericota bacterium]
MKVSVIIPAFNEEKTIGEVVETARNNPFVDEVIVVNDASTDRTPIIAKKKGAKVINFNQNKGKGWAYYEGVKASEGDIIIFLDADLIGLEPNHITELIRPIIEGEAVTTCGIFEKGRFLTDFSHKITPFLSGQRALTREVWENFSYDPNVRYGFEIVLTEYFWSNKIKVRYVILEGVTQLMKEEKVGKEKGRKWRFKMYKDIAKSVIKIAVRKIKGDED